MKKFDEAKSHESALNNVKKSEEPFFITSIGTFAVATKTNEIAPEEPTIRKPMGKMAIAIKKYDEAKCQDSAFDNVEQSDNPASEPSMGAFLVATKKDEVKPEDPTARKAVGKLTTAINKFDEAKYQEPAVETGTGKIPVAIK